MQEKKGMVETMRKKITTIALVAALAVGQSVCAFAANSPSTRPVISDSGSDGTIGLDGGSSSSSTSSSRPAQSSSTATAGSNTTSTSAGNDTIGIAVGQGTSNGTVSTNSRGQAVVGDTALEFVQGSDHAVRSLRQM